MVLVLVFVPVFFARAGMCSSPCIRVCFCVCSWGLLLWFCVSSCLLLFACPVSCIYIILVFVLALARVCLFLLLLLLCVCVCSCATCAACACSCVACVGSYVCFFLLFC